MHLTNHARTRTQQRGFNKKHVDLILNYGSPRIKPGNAIEYYIGRKEKNRLIEQMRQKIKLLESCADKAVLVDSAADTVITTYNLY
ncbi:MAG: hypothetical protein SWC96_09890 [Thermodesulfobacteriota bacterium]|nr:hypothetical protein [Thermodesulfobacteriota bacterium]